MRMQVQRTITALVLALGTAAFVVGVAQADSPGEPTGIGGPGAVTETAVAPDWFERAAARAVARAADGLTGTAAAPDWFERAAARAAGVAGTAVAPDWFERATARRG